MTTEEEQQSLFDAKIVLTFAAENIDEANQVVDGLLDWLEESGYELGPATIEESIPLEYT